MSMMPEGRVQKALYVLQMNKNKPNVKPVTKLLHVKELRDACAALVEWYDN